MGDERRAHAEARRIVEEFHAEALRRRERREEEKEFFLTTNDTNLYLRYAHELDILILFFSRNFCN